MLIFLLAIPVLIISVLLGGLPILGIVLALICAALIRGAFEASDERREREWRRQLRH
jgi:hypothetical protein